jgi:hypothetical protein
LRRPVLECGPAERGEKDYGLDVLGGEIKRPLALHILLVILPAIFNCTVSTRLDSIEDFRSQLLSSIHPIVSPRQCAADSRCLHGSGMNGKPPLGVLL